MAKAETMLEKAIATSSALIIAETHHEKMSRDELVAAIKDARFVVGYFLSMRAKARDLLSMREDLDEYLGEAEQ